MPILKYFLILSPTVLLGVFLYYRGLVWLGENIRLDWLKTIIIIILHLITSFGWLVWTFTLIQITSEPEAPDFFIQFIMSAAIFMTGAVLSYKKYKPRLDAVGISFRN